MENSALPSPQLAGKCLTCLGTGEVGSTNGPATCPDCDGSGRPPRRHLLAERRVREIEARFRNDSSQAGVEVAWLAFELRRAREALMKILTISGELPGDPLAQDVWHMANDVLGVYEPERLRAPGPAPKA